MSHNNFRPPDIVVGGLNVLPRFYLLSICLLLFHRLPSELAERNSTKTSRMLASKCDLKMYVGNQGYFLLVKIEGQTITF